MCLAKTIHEPSRQCRSAGPSPAELRRVVVLTRWPELAVSVLDIKLTLFLAWAYRIPSICVGDLHRRRAPPRCPKARRPLPPRTNTKHLGRMIELARRPELAVTGLDVKGTVHRALSQRNATSS